MIQIIYRPLAGLKPLHLALMGVMEVPGGADDFESRLSLPQMMVEHAVDDLVSWKFAERNASQVVLSSKGKLALSVWVVTERKGCWQFEDDGTWLLGKGKFSFRSPLALLSDAGLDPETGEVLSDSKAKEILKSFYQKRAEIEKRISDKLIAKQLDEALPKKGNLTEIIDAELSKAVTVLQLNQMSKMALKSLGDALAGHGNSTQRSEGDMFRKCREAVAKTKEDCVRGIKDGETILYSATRVLLAEWLKRRDGLLKSIAETDPGSLLVVSECGDVSWIEERMVSEGVQAEVASEDSLFTSIGKFIGSFFR
jgi:hypothetical protein